MAQEAGRPGKRIRFLDIAKGIGILMVTFGHITELDNPVDHYMSLYKITMFYFVSGYLLSYLNRYKETGYGKYILGVCRHIGLPYVLFSIAAILVRMFQAFIKMKDVKEAFWDNFEQFITLEGIATLWFLPTIFFSQIILFIIVKNIDKLIGKILLVSIVVWPVPILYLWDTYDLGIGTLAVMAKSLIAVWFMAAGFLYHYMIHDRLDPKMRLAIGIALSLFTLWLSTLSLRIDFNMMKFGVHPWVFFVGGITGSLGLLMVLEWLENIYVPKLLEYFGINSLILMCAQRGLLFLNIIKSGWAREFRLTHAVCARYFAERLCILVLLLLMTVGLIELIDASKSMLADRKRLRTA